MDKGKEGFVKVVDFNQSINTDQINENVYPFDDGVAPHLSNTGILHDQAVTNLYSTSVDASATYDQVLIAPNGAKLGIKMGSGSKWGQVYLNDTMLSENLNPWCLKTRGKMPPGTLDFAISSTGTYLVLSISSQDQNSRYSGRYRITEWDSTLASVLGYYETALGVFLDWDVESISGQAVLIKGPQLTLNTVGIAARRGNTYLVYTNVSGTFTINTVFTGASAGNTDKGIAAFVNGGRIVFGGISTATGVVTGYYNTVAGAYGAWTALTECAYIFPTYSKPIIYDSATSLSLVGIPSNLQTANHATFYTYITVSSAGAIVVTPNTVAGLTVVPSDTYNGWGYASGRFKSTAATKFSPFLLDTNATIAVISSNKTVTDYVLIPQSYGMIASTGGEANIGIATVNGIASHYTLFGPMSWSSAGGVAGSSALTEPGTVNPYYCPVVFGNNAQTVMIASLPVSIQGEASTQYAVIQKGAVGAMLYSIKAISKDVVVVNNADGMIINCVSGKQEVSVGGASNAFFTDAFLSGSNLVAWQTTQKYTNALDLGTNPGIVSGASGVAGLTSSIIPVSSASAIGPQPPMRLFFQGTPGNVFSYVYSVSYSGTGKNAWSPTNITYVVNSNLPATLDAVYSGGGVQQLSFSALQTVNESDADGFAQYYAGYTLANQYPVSYQFFNLFGTLYGYDGWKIYRMPVNGATAGTPEQVAYAQGLTLIAYSPKVALFLSAYDNSLYIYNGGQDVNRYAETTGVATIQSGVYSQRENAMFLQLADSTVLIIRDDKFTQTPATYASQTMTATDTGVYFSNTASPAQYAVWSYTAGSGTPITLTWQSGFYGWGRDMLVFVNAIVFTLRVPSPSTTAVTVNYKWIDGGANGTETVTFPANSYTASSTGYVRLVVRPTQTKGYGVSFGIQSAQKVWLYDATLYYNDGGPGYNTVPAGNQLSTS